MKFFEKLFNRESANHRLRKAVIKGNYQRVAKLIEKGASPVYMSPSIHEKKSNSNALILACKTGNVEILDLLLDVYFRDRTPLRVWGREMYHVVIRRGHWHAFLRLQHRNVPMNPPGNISAVLPHPLFTACEYGHYNILGYLLKKYHYDWRAYCFKGHSILSIASKNGHYECVDKLLTGNFPPHVELLEFAIDCARRNYQAHVMCLLNNYLRELMTGMTPTVGALTTRRSSAAETDTMSDVEQGQRLTNDLLMDDGPLQDERMSGFRKTSMESQERPRMVQMPSNINSAPSRLSRQAQFQQKSGEQLNDSWASTVNSSHCSSSFEDESEGEEDYDEDEYLEEPLSAAGKSKIPVSMPEVNQRRSFSDFLRQDQTLEAPPSPLSWNEGDRKSEPADPRALLKYPASGPKRAHSFHEHTPTEVTAPAPKSGPAPPLRRQGRTSSLPAIAELSPAEEILYEG